MRDHHHSKDPHREHVMLDIGADVGALVIYTGPELHGTEIEISPAARDAARSHKQVHDRPVGVRSIYAAVFDRLPAGEYTLWVDEVARARGVAVEGATITELDWRGVAMTW
jgi:hypothetical protein